MKKKSKTPKKRLANKAERENVDLVVLAGDITGFVDTQKAQNTLREDFSSYELLCSSSLSYRNFL